MVAKSKNYEFAYLLSPSIPENEILTYAGKVTTLVEETKGTVRHVEEPRRRQLAYPVEKQKNACFGWTTFAMTPENLLELKKKLKKEESFLRYLLLEEEVEMRPPMRRIFPPRPAKPRPIPREIPKTEEKLDLEALDRKLEEILGK